MYEFKIEKKDEYLDGRKLGYVAEKVGITREYLTYILKGQKPCTKVVAYCIVKCLHNELEIEDFFTRIEK